MQSLQSQVRAARGPARDALLRAGVALIYAHWEGYCKNALTLYLKFVARRKLKLRELRPGFAALAVDSAVRKQGNLTEVRRRMSTVTQLMDGLDDRLAIPSKEVNTQSNLNSEVCEELLEMLGLDFTPFATKAHLIDYKLLRARNEIAHGRWSPVDLAAFEELYSEVLMMIRTVRNLVTTAADNGEYRRVVV